MKIYRQNTAVLIYSLAMLALVSGILITSTTWDEERVLKWASALSGWVAAVVGGGTILVLIWQMKRNEMIAHTTQRQATHVFDKSTSQVLRNINDLWKHVEDILSSQNQNIGFRTNHAKAIKRRMENVHSDIVTRELDQLFALMHPSDAIVRRELLRRMVCASEPLLVLAYSDINREPKMEEADEVIYLPLLRDRFENIYSACSEISEELVSIFANRDTVEKRFGKDLIQDLWRETVLAPFPNNPENPY